MADSYTPNLGLTLMENGTHNNTWNDEYLNNDERIDAKIGDVTTINSTGGTQVLTGTQERVNVVKVTGALVSSLTVEFSGVGGAWVIQNDTTGAFGLTVKVTGQTGVSVAQGNKSIVYFNGTDLATLSAETAANLGLGTGDSPQFAGVNIGHASDTTLSRGAAGRLDIEGGTGSAFLAGLEVGHATDTTITRSAAGIIAVEGKKHLNANYGSFFVGKTSNQAVGSLSEVRVAWSESVTGGLDVNSEFTSDRWTPKIAGKVFVATGVYFDPTSANDPFIAIIRKNAVGVSSGGGVGVSATLLGPMGYASASAVIDVNGTTDYIDVSFISLGGGNILWEIGTLGVTVKSMSWFTGHYC